MSKTLQTALHTAMWSIVVVAFLGGCQARETHVAAPTHAVERSETGAHVAQRPTVIERSDAGVPLLAGMGDHKRTITTSSPKAQQYFDQGLTLAYAFNHDEAIRSFTEAARLDPRCAICWWGVALCNGPHINNPVMTPERSAAAWDAFQKAGSFADNATPTEHALIKALKSRYANPAPADRKPLDEAYAQAMRQVWNQNKTDADVGTLFVESLMDLQPWDLWNKDGSPKGNTKEIVATLEEVMRLDPDHPGALHLYIHAMEASATPGKAITAADRLRKLVPAAGHLVHMPSHIDVLTGRWALASSQNEDAIEADRRYREISPKQDFYHVYMAHNHHMLAFANMMQGRRAECLAAGRAMIAGVPADYAKTQAALVDGVAGIVFESMLRFGMWDDVLKEPAPPEFFPITTALWHYARGVAHAAKGQIAEAEAERAKFKDAAAKVPPDAMLMINKAHKMLPIAEHMLEGEIAYRKGNIDEAVTHLEKAIAFEDALMYMEPPEWVQPVRHTLGAILVDAGRYEEAEKVYRADLKEWPENGWSLFGLEKCLRARGADAEANEVAQRFKKTWAHADTKIGSSCLCVRAKS